MRIWYFNHYAGGPGIGNAMRAYHLGKRWVRAGHSVTVFFASDHHLRDEAVTEPSWVEGVEYVPLHARPYAGNGLGRLWNMVSFCWSMLALRREDRPDAVIASSPHPFCILPARWIAKRSSARLIFEVRDLWPLSLTEIAGLHRHHPIVKLVGLAERYAYRNADVVVSLLGGSEPHMREKGLAPGKFVHLPNGIDFDAPAPTPPASDTGEAAWKWMQDEQASGRKVIIHPGSQGVPNALDRLIDAMRLLAGASVSALLVGNGSETDKLKQMADGLPVAFFPPVPKNDALWLTAHADIGYSGGRQLPIYRFGSSLNKVADFIRFSIPFVEVIPSGHGILTDGDHPKAIADAILKAAAGGKNIIDQAALDYDVIAERYLQSLACS